MMNLHAVATKNVDARIRHCAHVLLDERLLAKLSVGDMIAIEAKCHARCLVGVYNDDGLDLYAIDSLVIVDRKIANDLKNIAKIGSEQYNSFVNDCLVNRCRPLDDPISRNRLAPFCQPSVRVRKDSKLSSVKNDCALFSRLYIGCHTRGGNCIGKWESLCLEELWIAFGVGDKFRHIAVHEIVKQLSTAQCKALPFFPCVYRM
jgi:hypothetical protein